MRSQLTIKITTITVFFAAITIAAFMFLPTNQKHKEKKNNYKALKAKNAPINWHFKQRAFPYKKINHQAYKKAREEVRMLQRSREKQPWTFSGPYNISGRITDIEVARGITLVSGATGGIYASTDNNSYSPIFDEQNSLAIGDMAIAPGDSTIIYVGTGDPIGRLCYNGDGVYKSTDQGGSWENIGLQETGSISKICVHPENSDIAYVGAMGKLFSKNSERGVYKTTDGGENWEKILFLNDSTGIIDLHIDPNQPNTLYAVAWERINSIENPIYGGVGSAIYRSWDGGQNWERLTDILPQSSSRIGMDIAASSSNILYAAYSDPETTKITNIYKSEDYGDTWTERSTSGIIYDLGFYYFGKLYVSPHNPDILYITNMRLYKSNDSGDSWNETFVGTHVDHHTIAFHPDNAQHVYIGTDGGLYISYNGGSTYIQPDSIPFVQFYHCEIDATNPASLYGGTQDNSLMRTTTGSTNDWEIINIADGFYSIVDPTDNNYIYTNCQYGYYFLSEDGGDSFSQYFEGLNGDRRNWNTPLIMNPNNPEVIYTAAEKVFKSNNRGKSWFAISEELTNEDNGYLIYNTITTLAISSINENIIIAGTDDGNVSITADSGATWNNISPDLPKRYVTRVLTDKYDENTIYVTFSGYHYGYDEGHIFKSEDLGENWTSISGDMPNVPVNSLLHIAPNQYIAATDVGVFETKNGGEQWNILGTNVPPLVFTDLDYFEPDQKLIASTFGRGMYSMIIEAENAIDETPKLQFSAYPNPATDYVTIKTGNSLTGNKKITIYDMHGRAVENILNVRENEIKINTNNLTPGKYIIHLEQKNTGQTTTQKFVKI